MNELTFEDEAGREEVYIHAERDRNEKTRNNHSERIDRNWVQSIGSHKASEVSGNFYEVVGRNMNITVGQSATTEVSWPSIVNDMFGIGAVALMDKIPGSGERGDGNYSLAADHLISLIAGYSFTASAEFSTYIRSGTSVSIDSGGVILLNGDSSVSLSAGTSMTMNAGEQMILKCGQAALVLHHDGTIEISGTMLLTRTTDGVSLQGGPQVEISADRIDLNP